MNITLQARVHPRSPTAEELPHPSPWSNKLLRAFGVCTAFSLRIHSPARALPPIVQTECPRKRKRPEVDAEPELGPPQSSVTGWSKLPVNRCSQPAQRVAGSQVAPRLDGTPSGSGAGEQAADEPHLVGYWHHRRFLRAGSATPSQRWTRTPSTTARTRAAFSTRRSASTCRRCTNRSWPNCRPMHTSWTPDAARAETPKRLPIVDTG